MRNVKEAFDFTIEKIEKLKSNGIRVDIEKIESEIKDNQVSLPVEHWIKVKIFSENLSPIFAVEDELLNEGISFETDNDNDDDHRVWFLDWSFSFQPGWIPVKQKSVDTD